MVNKNTLQSLISKYYLNGSFNQVKWRIKDNTITVYAGSSGKAAKVYLKNFQFGLLIKTATNLDGERVCEMIFGDIENFANKVTYTLNGTITDEIEFPLNSDSLKDIFSANKDADRGVLKVSAQGMIQLNFYSDEMESEYFVLRNE